MIAAAVRKSLIFGDATDPREPGDSVLPASALCHCHARASREIHAPPLPSYRRTRTPLVSVLCPTSTERHWAHANLYRCFIQQTWPEKELIVLDTGERPSPFFSSLSDSRVRYTHVALTPDLASTLDGCRAFVAAVDAFGSSSSSHERWKDSLAIAHAAIEHTSGRSWWELEDETCDSPAYLDLVARVITLGAKRNWLASAAHGEVLANFDDDDVYLPAYLERMVSALLAHDASFIKLASFMHLDMVQRVLHYSDAADSSASLLAANEPFGGFVDPQSSTSTSTSGRVAADGRPPPPMIMTRPDHGLKWGYGFSYVYSRELATSCPHDPINFGEDYRLVQAAAAAGKRCLCFSEVVGSAVCIHISHLGSSSSVVCGRHLMGLPFNEKVGAATTAQFDAYFTQPCWELVVRVSADYVVGQIAALREARQLEEERWSPAWDEQAEGEYLLLRQRQRSLLLGDREESSVARVRLRVPS